MFSSLDRAQFLLLHWKLFRKVLSLSKRSIREIDDRNTAASGIFPATPRKVSARRCREIGNLYFSARAILVVNCQVWEKVKTSAFPWSLPITCLTVAFEDPNDDFLVITASHNFHKLIEIKSSRTISINFLDHQIQFLVRQFVIQFMKNVTEYCSGNITITFFVV